MVYYGCLWVLWSSVPFKMFHNMTSDSSTFFFKWREYPFTRKNLKERLKQPQNPQNQVKSRLSLVISGRIWSNLVQSGCFWHSNVSSFRNFCGIFFSKIFIENFNEVFLKFCFYKMSHYWTNMSGSVFYFNKFKNITSICSILWSHLNKSKKR